MAVTVVGEVVVVGNTLKTMKCLFFESSKLWNR
uniref:Uncharacterized protein n=1 Tax=Anguilla anguilla TaxID=7936 RepID=A0A0E9Q8J6_ANGAN